MGRMKKEGTSGARTAYITRAKAVRKLQLTLKDFRRLCILKGIYPVEPKNRKKVSGGNSQLKTYYLLKDIQLLTHEPLIWKFWDFKIFMRKIARAKGRREYDLVKHIKENRPFYKVDHLVRERYPTFSDALKDLDDALSMLFLYGCLSAGGNVPAELIELSRRMSVEFMHYVIETRSLRKAFISLKGYYFQAQIMDQTVTWVIPHKFVLERPVDVDMRVMKTFVEFYITLLGFVNYKLFASINLYYPPKVVGSSTTAIMDIIDSEDDEKDLNDDSRVNRLKMKRQREAFDLLVSLNVPLDKNLPQTEIEAQESRPDEFDLSVVQSGPDEIQDEENQGDTEAPKQDQFLSYIEIMKLQKLFEGQKFYISREVPRETFTFFIRSFGGSVSWDETCGPGFSYQEKDESITYQLVDRPSVPNKFMNRVYVQPQWVVDSINTGLLLPAEPYFPGKRPPPHLSPFVVEREGDYLPEERLKQLQLMGKPIPVQNMGSLAMNDDEDLNETPGGVTRRNARDEKTAVDDGEDDEADGEENEPKPKKIKKEKATKGIAVKTGKVTKDPQPVDAEKAHKKLAVMMIPKKKKRLYEKIVKGQKQHKREVENLKSKKNALAKQARAEKCAKR